jgi:hypothetical protein
MGLATKVGLSPHEYVVVLRSGDVSEAISRWLRRPFVRRLK